MIKSRGIDRYSTFGFREEWLLTFISNINDWQTNNKMGPRQRVAFTKWLEDAELITEKDRTITDLAVILTQLRTMNVIWGIIWVNLFYNSTIVNWYCKSLDWNKYYAKHEMLHRLKNQFFHLKESTLTNPLYALFDTFKKSTIGKSLGVLEKKGKKLTGVFKRSFNDVDPLVIGYSLYRYSEKVNRKLLLLKELYSNALGGPFTEFGIEINSLRDTLFSLQENYKILRVEFTRDLDNIFLKQDLTAIEVLKKFLNK